MIPLFKVFMSKKVDKDLLSTLHSGWIGEGPKVKEFEKVLSEKFNNPYCLTLSAGTHGIHLALRLAEVGPGDEVICTPLTCTASNWPVLYQGAKIVWADINHEDLNIDPFQIERKITTRTKAVIVVHWGGYPCDLERIYRVCQERSIVVIEDAAHAYGATYNGSKIGDCNWSDFCMFSFQAIKHLTAVDGGALFCKSPIDYHDGRLLRWYGIDREGPRIDLRCEADIPDFGYKYHMNDVCATIGLKNMEEVDRNIKITRENAKYYEKELRSIIGIEVPQMKSDRQSPYWLFTIYVEDRTGFARHMGEKGIMVSRVHERNDKHSCVKEFETDLPVLEEVIQKMICIPVGWWITKEDREYIIESIKEGW